MKKSYTVKLEGKEWTNCLHEAYNKKKKDIKLDGFRKGLVPYEIYVKKVGVESLYMDAIDMAVDTMYAKLLSDPETITPAATPSIDILDVNSNLVEIEFTLVSTPEVKLGKYKNLGVKKETVKVTEEEIEHELGHLKEQFAEVKTLDDKTKIKEGMIAVIDFEGFKDGVAFKGGKGENYSLTIGSNTFIPGFEDQLVGMKKGEEKEIEVTFPKDYQAEELKGAKATFKVKVNEVKEVKIPELDKDFFEDLGIEGVDSKEKLENHVKEHILAHKEHHAEEHYIDDLLEAAAKNTKIDIPEVMIKEEQDRMLKQYEENLMMQGVTLKQFYEFTKSDEQALRDQMKEEATKRITYRLMLEQIAKEEKIEVSEEEAQEEAEKMAEKYNMTKEELVKNLGGLDMLIYDAKMRKAIETLKK